MLGRDPRVRVVDPLIRQRYHRHRLNQWCFLSHDMKWVYGRYQSTDSLFKLVRCFYILLLFVFLWGISAENTNIRVWKHMPSWQVEYLSRLTKKQAPENQVKCVSIICVKTIKIQIILRRPPLNDSKVDNKTLTHTLTHHLLFITYGERPYNPWQW
jgi:hypothetical protein